MNALSISDFDLVPDVLVVHSMCLYPQMLIRHWMIWHISGSVMVLFPSVMLAGTLLARALKPQMLSKGHAIDSSSALW